MGTKASIYLDKFVFADDDLIWDDIESYQKLEKTEKGCSLENMPN